MLGIFLIFLYRCFQFFDLFSNVQDHMKTLYSISVPYVPLRDYFYTHDLKNTRLLMTFMPYLRDREISIEKVNLVIRLRSIICSGKISFFVNDEKRKADVEKAFAFYIFLFSPIAYILKVWYNL